MIIRMSKRFGVLALLSVLAACSNQEKTSYSASTPSSQVKIGKPYVIDGKTYYPEYNPTYDQTGEASWYGPGFHGKYTANGEIFNQDDLTAAHPTLPMPSLVRVTNLSNGKSLIVRINDRGPFKNNRIIDLSKASAQRLGVSGVTEVRVQFLPQETSEYLANLGSGDPVDMFALNETIGSKASGLSTGGAPVASVGSSELAAPIASSPAPVNVASDAPVTVSAAEPRAFQPPPRDRNIDQSKSQAALIKEVWAEDNTVTTANDNIGKPVHFAHETPAKAASKVASISPASGGPVVIQVGSFSTEQNAKKIQAKLSGIGSAAIDKVQVNDKTWYRVRLGPYNDKASAESVLGQVHSAGATDARIMRNI